jgi:hypothetical protein
MPSPKAVSGGGPIGLALPAPSGLSNLSDVSTPAPDKWTKAKVLGDENHEKGNYVNAIKWYDVAIQHATKEIETKKSVAKLFIRTCLSNKALSKYMMNDDMGCIADCGEALAIDDKYAKLYFRRGDAYARKMQWWEVSLIFPLRIPAINITDN